MNRTQSTISVQHVSISIQKTFSETCSRFESRMDGVDSAVFNKMLTTGEPETAVQNYVKGIGGPLGLMIFNAIDHGLLFRLARIYLGPDAAFPPATMRNTPGYITRITPTRFAGIGPWNPQGAE